MKKFSLIILAGLLVFAACKKNSSTPTIVGKWTTVSYAYLETQNGRTIMSDTVGAQANSYLDFRTDGKVYGHDGSIYDTASYKVLNNNTQLQETFQYRVGSTTGYQTLTYQIQTLTAHSLVLFKAFGNPGDPVYQEETIWLKR